MGVALVNLVWRRLAVVPSVLHWSWETLKPHYQSGEITAAAWHLREQLALPSVNRFSATELNSLKQVMTDVTVIDDTLRTYERGNAMNLIALCYLRLCLNSTNGSAENPALCINQSSIDRLDSNQSIKQRADAQFGEIPKLPQLKDLPEDIQLLIARSSEIWVPAKYKGLTPSVFRHLAYWPDLLSLIANRLEAIERVSAPSIGSVAAQALTLADRHAAGLGGNSTELPELNNTDRQWLQQVLEVFLNGVLARGVIIVPTLRSLLP